ncbi:MAG: nuclear transport factor 2 family protein [Polyangiaceae bacterium]
MTTFEIAKKYIELCRAHQNHIALETLFSPSAVSVEAAAMPGMAAESLGLKAIAEKGKQWMETHEVHSSKLEGPWPHGDRFAVRFTYDVTNKPSGRHMQMDEIGLFTVENDKIVREEFFYSTEG